MRTYIPGLIKVGVGAAIGLSIGYFTFKADAEDCKGVYQKQMSELEEKYKSVPIPEGVAASKDFSLDYVVSEKGGFKGYVFTDNASGKQGVIAKSNVLGNRKYFFEYVPLDGIVDGSEPKVAAQPEIKVYGQK